MSKPRFTLSFMMILSLLLLAACGANASAANNTSSQAATQASPTLALDAAPTSTAQANGSTAQLPAISGGLSAFQDTLETIYNQVSPSVVNIQVTQGQTTSSGNGQVPGVPFFGFPGGGQNSPQISQALGSGFVWDVQGDIVTNNHVVDGADTIQVTFSDGSTVPATLVGADVNSDLAVIKVDVPADKLKPVTLADSTQVKVGQVAIAIGNPFGLEGTMTAGIISGLGRSLPVGLDSNTTLGPTYSIPDVIQTDAAINPGNSGGVLVNDQGQVMGVTSAIDSPVRANSGVGFVIPSEIVQKIVPVLIQSGHYDQPWLGISGTSLTPDLAKAMNLNSDQRGALVETIVPGGPADKAGLRRSDRQATILGQTVPVGGDVITAIDGQPVTSMDDLIAYLFNHTEAGQKITLNILRDGKEQSLELTLGTRPSQSQTQQALGQQGQTGSAWLGIVGTAITPAVAQAMNMSADQTGILVEQVESGSPADMAGLQGSSKPFTNNGRRITIGGDVIIAIDGHQVSQVRDLQAFLQVTQPGQEITLTILRSGQTMDVTVTLGQNPNQAP